MTNEEHARMTAAFVRKAEGLGRAGYTEHEWIACVVATVIADTALVLDGTLNIEQYE